MFMVGEEQVILHFGPLISIQHKYKQKELQKQNKIRSHEKDMFSWMRKNLLHSWLNTLIQKPPTAGIATVKIALSQNVWAVEIPSVMSVSGCKNTKEAAKLLIVKLV